MHTPSKHLSIYKHISMSISKLKPRECPHCQQKVSLKICSRYFLNGTNHIVRCNHCNTPLKLIKEPIPFQWCFSIGLWGIILPSYYFLFIKGLGLGVSLAYALLIESFLLPFLCVAYMKQLYFKQAT